MQAALHQSKAKKRAVHDFEQGGDLRLGPGGARLCVSIDICRDRVVPAQNIVHDALRHLDVHLQQVQHLWGS